MAAYLPIIISAIVIFTALMWWLLALGSVKKDAAPPTAETPPKAVPAPPVAAATPPAAPKAIAPARLMDDPKPASKTAPPKAQAPLKAAATKAAPTKTAAKPVAKKAAAPKAVAPKAVVAKVAAPKTAAKAAVKPKADPVPKAKPAAKAAPAPKAAPKPKAAPEAAAKPVIPDNLELLKGVGPKVNNLLKSMGITSFDQVANWTPADITEIDSKLGAFAGRIGRDNWVDQAKLLVAGDVAGFEKKYGALGSEVAKG
jgi:predicted flap endonuclease-1-like 5' DNA nuclease